MASCFYPDGSPAPGFPCWNTSSSDTYAPCCATGSYCYSNGWCLASNHMTVYRAGCTDQSWESNACVQECTGAPIGGIYKCDDNGHAACKINDCGTDKQFVVASGSLLLSGSAATKAVQAADYTLRSTSTSPSTAGSILPPTSVSSASSSSAATASSAIDSVPDCRDNDSGISVGTVAGVGTGVGVPLLAALTISLFLLRRERRKVKNPPSPTTPQWIGESGAEHFKQEPRYMDTHVNTHHELGNNTKQRAELPQ